MNRNIGITIEYDGTGFSGWQRQPGQRTVQGVIEHAVSDLLRQPVDITGASRTDAGVHAFGQRANFNVESPIPTERMKKAINGRLPADVRIIQAVEEDAAFHSRFSARGKTYVYKILNRQERDVFSRDRMLWVPAPLDVGAMASAAALFEGTHDFERFSANSGDEPTGTVRTIHRFRVTKAENDIILLRVTGNAFLYKMVRMMAGALIHIGLGAEPPEAVGATIAGDRERLGRTAQPHGLYLVRVYYDENEMMGELE